LDEPAKNAIFNVRLGRPEDYTSASNMQAFQTGVEDPDLPAGYVWDIFDPTFKMSSYLVAFLVSKVSDTS